MVEDVAQGACEGGGVGGVEVSSLGGGAAVACMNRSAGIPGEGGGAVGAVPVAEGVVGAGRDIETKAA